MKFRIKLWAFIIIAMTTNCVHTVKEEPKKVNDEYLNNVIKILKENSIESPKINWDLLVIDLNMRYPTISENNTRFHSINWVLKEYGFKHHSYMPHKFVIRWKNQSNNALNENTQNQFKYPEGKLVQSNIGYINIPQIMSGDSIRLELYARKTQEELKRLVDIGAKNWIVDLTQNQGGNMWPMLAGIGPLLGDGKLGSFNAINGEEISFWYYKDGKAYESEGDSIRYSVQTHEIIDNLAIDKIAILQSENTASSGEAVLVSFLGKKNIKTFGRKTATYSTSNKEFELPDSSLLWVTTSIFTDRKSNSYPNGIVPMEIVEDDSLLLNKAIFWLNKKSN